MRSTTSAIPSRALDRLLDEFQETLRARGRTPRWVELVVNRVRATFIGCGFMWMSDLDAIAIEHHLHARREGRVAHPTPRKGTRGRPPRTRISVRESNHRLQACKEFARWAVARSLLSKNPFDNLEPLNASIDPKHVRRALGPEDLRKLVLAAHNGPTVRSVTGPVRALAWRLGCEAGLRISEICALQAGDLDLDAPSGPMLTVRASVSKNRKVARLPLHGVLAHDLAPYTRGKLPTAPLLGLPASFRHRATFWLERDLTAAGLEYEDASGHVADVHSLRSSFITNLVRSGANVKAVQLLARHASPVETLGIYTRLGATEERDAISRLQVVSPSGDPCAP